MLGLDIEFKGEPPGGAANAACTEKISIPTHPVSKTAVFNPLVSMVPFEHAASQANIRSTHQPTVGNVLKISYR